MNNRIQHSAPYISAIVFILLLGITATSRGQRAYVELERENILLGEQTNLFLRLENVDKEAMTLSTWFALPDTGNHVEVIKRDQIDTIEGDNNLVSYSQKVIITSFDSGNWKLPIVAPLITSLQGDLVPISFEPVALQVNPVDVSQLKDFHPIKGVAEVDYTDYSWLYYVLAVILSALLIYLFIKWRKKRKKKLLKKKQKK